MAFFVFYILSQLLDMLDGHAARSLNQGLWQRAISEKRCADGASTPCVGNCVCETQFRFSGPVWTNLPTDFQHVCCTSSTRPSTPPLPLVRRALHSLYPLLFLALFFFPSKRRSLLVSSALFATLAFDVGGHWLHFFASSAMGASSHKVLPQNSFRILREYYSRRGAMASPSSALLSPE